MKIFDFKKARPVWSAGREKEKNLELAFYFILEGGIPHPLTLYLATSCVYRIWINGIFIGFGPARTAHGVFKVDPWPLDRYIKEKTHIVIEALGNNVNTYDTLEQDSFLIFEVCSDEESLIWTGDDRVHCFSLNQRIQRIQRYSFQRAFSEAYRINDGYNSFLKGLVIPQNQEEELGLVSFQQKYLVRDVPIPEFKRLLPRIEDHGTLYQKSMPNIIEEEHFLKISDEIHGYSRNETEFHISEEAQKIGFLVKNDDIQEKNSLSNEFRTYELPYDAPGFFQIRINALSACKIWVLFDEIFLNEQIDFLRMTSCNCCYYEMGIGESTLRNFVPFTMKFIRIAIQGQAYIEQMDFIEYIHPPVTYFPDIPVKDVDMNTIANAARNTFLSNAVDIYMDCPSRERGGWLCDSFFTSSVEYVLTGKADIEHAFLENFLLHPADDNLPDGMFPMCYPADHNNHVFIPNWAMWYVIELKKYYNFTKDSSLVELAKERIYKLLDYFISFENTDGLLENLDGWVFVEWSRANDEALTSGVNFPTNMLYYLMLICVSELYKDVVIRNKAFHLKHMIREHSIRGFFYTDHAGREDGKYINTGESTEVCQYYAFFSGVADVQNDRELWDTLVREFGKNRNGNYTEISSTNAFIGNYLRIELLFRQKLYDQVEEEIKSFFLKMAKTTGTLWEHNKASASCNHGFASYVLYWLSAIYGRKMVNQDHQKIETPFLT